MSLRMLLSEAIDKFLDYQRVRKGRTKDTINTYRSTLRQFLKFAGDKNIEDITVELIDDYAETLENYKQKTIYNKLTPIRSFVGFLYSKEISNLRKESIDLPTVQEVEANFLDEDEQRLMIDACQTPRERALILFLIASGLRVSELINTRTDDLFKRSVIIRRGKGGKPRVTFITKDVEDAVHEYHATLNNPFYLFPNEHGQKLSRQYVHGLVVTIARRAGLKKKVSPHTLRHTFGTNLLMRGARVEDVQKMMGHRNIRSTLIYMHFTDTYLHGYYDKIMKNPVPAY